MNTIKTFFIATLLFSSASAFAENKFQVIDRGIDGDQRQYLITCTDGTRGSVTKHFELPIVDTDPDKIEKKGQSAGISVPPKLIKVCIELDNGDEQCRPSWELDTAAKASCAL